MIHPVSRSKEAFFPYKPLDFDSHETRLLTLRPTSDRSIISCSIDHVSLIDPGDYIALSYCWGDAASTGTLFLNNERVSVTKNLASALRALQKKYGYNVRVWADALCINQQNNEERSHQVRNMRQIYSRASEVFCWVSEKSDPMLGKAVEYLLDLAKYSEPEMSSKQLEIDTSVIETYWNSLIEIFREPYWRRVWVIQEVAVASRATVSFGNHTLDWDYVANILRLLKLNFSLHSDDQYHLEPSFTNALHLLEIRERFFIRREPLSLLKAIQLTQHTLATDPRDKIFSLLGISHDSQIFVPVPNYIQPFELILTEMVKTMMAMDRCLNLIWIKGSFPKDSSLVLPSWVPHLHTEWGSRMTFQEAFQFTWEPFTANSPVLQGSNNEHLRVIGRCLGSISRLTTKVDSDTQIKVPKKRAPWIHLTSTLSQTNERLRNPTQLEVQIQEFIWETITMAQLPIDLLRSLFSNIWKPEGRGLIDNLALIAWIDQNAWFRVKDWTLREWSQVTASFILRRDQDGVLLRVMKKGVEWETAPQASNDDLIELIGVLDKILGSGMRLAVMRGYQSLGMVHPDSRENDELYLIRGSSIPVVLRKQWNKDGNKLYSVVGGGYTLATDPNSEYYRGTRDVEDALNWDGKEIEELTLC